MHGIYTPMGVLGGYNLLLHSFGEPVGSKEKIPMHGIYTPMGLEVTIAKIINLEFKPFRGYK